jgi:hypothetical protein
MSDWTPDWTLQINGVDYANITLANLTIASGRTDIYSQPRAGYCTFEIINLDVAAIVAQVNDGVIIRVKDSSGDLVDLFGGEITDITVSVRSSGSGGITQLISITALGALSKLSRSLTNGVLSKDFDGNQIYDILQDLLVNNWNEVSPAETWAAYNPTTTWANAENVGLGEIDRPGNYELMARTSNETDFYSLVSALATSGLGYIYESPTGAIGYADSTHRTTYLATNGYTDVSANDALVGGLQTITRISDVRNKISIEWRSGTETATDSQSVALYGQQASVISTTLHNNADAISQAAFYLALRAYPQAQFQAITFTLGNSELTDGDRDALLNVFMGLPLNIEDLPNNMVDGRFQGFVEGWVFRAAYNRLDLTLTLSPTAFSLQFMQWQDVSVAETWNTLSNTLTWDKATVVA